MKKTLVFCFLALVFSLSLVLAFQTTILKVKVQTANVRSEPDLNAAVVKTLRFGTILEASMKIGEWYEIIVDDESGNKISAFINSNVVNVIGGEAKPVQVPQQPEAAPVYEQPTGYVAPKTYSGGGIRLLGGLTSSNISYDKRRTGPRSVYQVSVGSHGGHRLRGRLAIQLGIRRHVYAQRRQVPRAV